MSAAQPVPGRRAQLYRAVFESSAGPVLLLDDERRAIDGNRAARGFLGISRTDLAGRALDEFAAPEVRPGLERAWALLLKDGSLRGVLPLELSNGLRRTVVFEALAAVSPGCHVFTFRKGEGSRRATEMLVHDSQQVPSLTARERQVLTLLARGSSAEAIAEVAVLSPETVRTHARNARQKLGAKTRSHAVALAILAGEIDP
ncbi:MAG: formate hydrogenlyase transcriptional activator [Thermoleophilaceae bacterium]|nr:formate hydrogenlyase transcriptional activator [Thermoleophilaceae bacterium]